MENIDILNMNQNNEPITVSEFNKYLSNYLKQNNYFDHIKIKGEIGNIKFSSTGHIYLNLKDEDALISVNIWKSVIQNLSKEIFNHLKEGSKIIIEGSIQLYQKGGTYNLIAKNILLDGIGDLYQKFLLVKEELQKAGFFNSEYKKAIKRFNYSVGVLTSKHGAVIKDIVSTIKRRFPHVELKVYNSQVQGIGVEKEIISNLKLADKSNHDVIIIARGGGSLEDLWPFNSKELAIEVFNSQTPIISAIGHETDYTILDFVSDLRAPTPTAAAEMINPFYLDIKNEVFRMKNSLNKSVQSYLDQLKLKLFDLDKKMNQIQERFSHFKNNLNSLNSKLNHLVLINLKQQKNTLILNLKKIDNLVNNLIEKNKYFLLNSNTKLLNIINQKITISKNNLNSLNQNFKFSFANIINQHKQKIFNLDQKLTNLNPKELLNRGYVQIYSQDKLVKSVKDLKINQEISLALSDGLIKAEVMQIKDKKN